MSNKELFDGKKHFKELCDFDIEHISDTGTFDIYAKDIGDIREKINQFLDSGTNREYVYSVVYIKPESVAANILPEDRFLILLHKESSEESSTTSPSDVTISDGETGDT